MNDNCPLSHELIIVKRANGIELVKPQTHTELNHLSLSQLELPFTFYLYDKLHHFKFSNQQNAIVLGYDSVKDSLRYPITSVLNPHTAKGLMISNRHVLTTRQPLITQETLYSDTFNALTTWLTFKLPWYSDHQELLGIFGCSLPYEARHLDKLADSLNSLNQMGLFGISLPHYPSTQENFKKIYLNELTRRENEIINYVVRGKTAKAIGIILHISPRTVEKHLANIKTKLKINSKSDMLNYIFDSRS